MNSFKSSLTWAPLVARILVGVMFLIAGFSKLTNFAGTVDFAQSAGLPLPAVAIAIAIAIEILGGLSLVLGYRIFWGALTLAVFVVITSFVFHGNFADPIQQLLFTKNMGIVAALLYMTHFGAGKVSLEK
ncbi:DoxX family protein [Candidatus Kaiserbacteria bacterium]|nr:DoxX family protein [Candidatus Kaiserbacteria bacterium]